MTEPVAALREWFMSFVEFLAAIAVWRRELHERHQPFAKRSHRLTLGHQLIGFLDQRCDFLLIHRRDQFVARRKVAVKSCDTDVCVACDVLETDARAFFGKSTLGRLNQSDPVSLTV